MNDSRISAFTRRSAAATPDQYRANIAKVQTAAIWILCSSVIIFQRIAVPATGIPISIPVAWVTVTSCFLLGAAVLVPSRALALSSLVALALPFSIALMYRPIAEPSLQSILLLLASWLPFTVAFVRAPTVVRKVTVAFLAITTATALICILQAVLQLAGLSFLDPLKTLPQEMLVPGYASTGSIQGLVLNNEPLSRSNGFVYLEASIASQFLAVACLLSLRYSPVLVVVNALGLLCTFSGTGLILLLIGAVIALITGSKRERTSAGLMTGLLIIAAVSPIGRAVAGRGLEFGESGSSGWFRFVEPWKHVVMLWRDSSLAAFTGVGAGGDNYTLHAYSTVGLGANYPAPVKLLIEYGLVVAIGALAAVVMMIARLAYPGAVIGPLIGVFALMSGSLIQPALTGLILIFAISGSKTGSGRATESGVQLQRMAKSEVSSLDSVSIR